ncbi:FAEL069C-Ap [Eremothecium gossypii FDAG1]|nr:FAEL069C-Ap [Eremothecium gossypii FDAG1]
MLVQLASPDVLDYSVCQGLLSGREERVLDVYNNGSSASNTFIVVCERSLWVLQATGKGLRLRRIASCETPVQKSCVSEGAVLVVRDNWVYQYGDEGPAGDVAMPVHAYSRGIRIAGDAERYYVDSRHSRYLWGPYRASALPLAVFALADPILDFQFEGSRVFSVKRLSHGRGYYVERVDSVSCGAGARRDVLHISDDIKHAPIFSAGGGSSATYVFVAYHYTWVVAKDTLGVRKFPNPPFIKRSVVRGAALYVEPWPRGPAPRGNAETLVLRVCTGYGAAYKATVDANADKTLRWNKLHYGTRSDTFNGCWYLGSERYLYSTGRKLVSKDFSSGTELSIRHVSASDIVHDLCILQLLPMLDNGIFSIETLTCGSYTQYDNKGFIGTAYDELSVDGLRSLTLPVAVAPDTWRSMEDFWLSSTTSASVSASDIAYPREGESLKPRLDLFQDILFCTLVQNPSGVPTKYLILRADGKLVCHHLGESIEPAFEFPTSCGLNERTLLSSFEDGNQMHIVAATDGIITVFELQDALIENVCTVSKVYLLATIPEVICSIHSSKDGVFVLTKTQLYKFTLAEMQCRPCNRTSITIASPPKFCVNSYGRAVLYHDKDYLYQYRDGQILRTKLPHRCDTVLQKDENTVYMLATDSKLWEMKVMRKSKMHTHIEDGTVFTKVTTCIGSTKAIICAETGEANIQEKLVLYDFGSRRKLAECDLDPKECVINLYSFFAPMSDSDLNNSKQLCIATTYTATNQYIRLFAVDGSSLFAEDRKEVKWIVTDIKVYGNMIVASGERLAVYFLQEENGELTLCECGNRCVQLSGSLTMGTVIHEDNIFLFDAHKGITVFRLHKDGLNGANIMRSTDAAGYPSIEHNTITHVASTSVPWSRLFNLNAAAYNAQGDVCFEDRKELWHSTVTFAAVCDASGCVTLFQFSPASIERGTDICRFEIKQTILKLVSIPTSLSEHITELPPACTPLFALYLEDGSVRIISNGKVTPNAQPIESSHNLRACRYSVPNPAATQSLSGVSGDVFSFRRQRVVPEPSKSVPQPLAGPPCIRIFVSGPPSPPPLQRTFSPPELDLTL